MLAQSEEDEAVAGGEHPQIAESHPSAKARRRPSVQENGGHAQEGRGFD